MRYRIDPYMIKNSIAGVKGPIGLPAGLDRPIFGFSVGVGTPR